MLKDLGLTLQVFQLGLKGGNFIRSSRLGRGKLRLEVRDLGLEAARVDIGHGRGGGRLCAGA